jgi:hypothetical protein
MTSRNLLSWVFIVTVILAGCTPIQAPTSESAPTLVAPLTSTGTVAASSIEISTPIDPVQTREAPPPPNGRSSSQEAPVPWVTDEIIVLGATEDIGELLLASEAMRALQPELVGRFDLTPLFNQLLESESSRAFLNELFGQLPSSEKLDQGIVAELYRFHNNTDIPRLIESVDSVREASDLFAFAEPNFWFTSLQNDEKQICVSFKGQPNSFGNGPFGTRVERVERAFRLYPEDLPRPDRVRDLPRPDWMRDLLWPRLLVDRGLADFNQQWAFQLLADNPADSTSSDPLSTDVSEPGTDPVDVVIFDNSPFTGISETIKIMQESTDIGDGVQQPVDLSPTQPMTLHVWHAEFSHTPAEPVDDSDEHGVFIASLIHKIAPNSTLKLVRVLDRAGCGTSFTINAAIRTLIQIEIGKKAVFNLSFGIPELDFASSVMRFPLQGVLAAAMNENKIVVVAAAGNDHGNPLLLPASYVDNPSLSQYVKVLAVEASNSEGYRACFSNKGKDSNNNGISDRAILAPGGEGKLPESECKPELDSCVGKPTCEQAIMGVTHDGRWIFWSGTSFATPMVGGAAARWLSQGCDRDKVINHLITDYSIDGSLSLINLTSLMCP